MGKERKQKRWNTIAIVLAAVWLALAHMAPHLPPTSYIAILFGLAPPLFLVAPPLVFLTFLIFRSVGAKDLRPGGLWIAGISIAIIPLFGFILTGPISTDWDKQISVMTFNVHFDSRKMPQLLDYIKANKIDLVFLQENKGQVKGGLDQSPAAYLRRQLPGWRMASNREVAILSRWPITSVHAVPMISRNARSILVAEIDGPQKFQAITTHWSVPQFTKGVPALKYDAENQEREFKLTLNQIARAKLPLIVGGDFNNPPHHPITVALSKQLENCFATRGGGFGWTYPTSFPLVRIDHLYVNDRFETVSATVGPNLGSDHLPLIARVGFVFGRR